MSTFSIKDIEIITGIKGHTLRIWEQRYGILKPKRTETNIRYYDDEDLKTLLNISLLNNSGYKISEIAKLKKEEINNLVLNSSSQKNLYDVQIKTLISSMLCFDESAFHRMLTTCVLQHGLEHCMIHIVFPFLNEVGILWQVGSIHPSHEHFVTNLIKQKLYVAIDGQIGKENPNSKTFLLFLPENEQHSIGLLFANYILRNRGHKVLYLGQQVPLSDLANAFINFSPDFIFSVLTAAQDNSFKQKLVIFLTSNWPKSQIVLTGSQVLNCDLDFGSNIMILKKTSEFIIFVDSLSNSDSERQMAG
ncbi:MAG: MerR family transcriptional regulator [Bacteroidia bacterium]